MTSEGIVLPHSIKYAHTIAIVELKHVKSIENDALQSNSSGLPSDHSSECELYPLSSHDDLPIFRQHMGLADNLPSPDIQPRKVSCDFNGCFPPGSMYLSVEGATSSDLVPDVFPNFERASRAADTRG
ncbi:hypothetical protein FRC15_010509 [Serendipita sp. 397]|nr:hypothetical protein FRC15_010509 [Serendipita sp. 397]